MTKKFLKFFICTLAMIVSLKFNAQQKTDNSIDYNKKIAETENLLKTLHPDDVRVYLLKKKITQLKNEAWTAGAKNSKPMAARPVNAEFPKEVSNSAQNHLNEAEEFKKLTAETSIAHKDKTVKLLNALFDQDINSAEAILMVQNNSDCNMILRIEGDKHYDLAIAAHSENSIVLPKGDYMLTSNLCDTKYLSKKEIRKNQLIILNKQVFVASEKPATSLNTNQ